MNKKVKKELIECIIGYLLIEVAGIFGLVYGILHATTINF